MTEVGVMLLPAAEMGTKATLPIAEVRQLRQREPEDPGDQQQRDDPLMTWLARCRRPSPALGTAAASGWRGCAVVRQRLSATGAPRRGHPGEVIPGFGGYQATGQATGQRTSADRETAIAARIARPRADRRTP
jgi:hypothetical protein